MYTSSKAVLERLKAIPVSAASAVEEHLAPADFVIEVPLVLSTQHVNRAALLALPIDRSFVTMQ